MASGMEMMLKSMGVDIPGTIKQLETLKKNVEEKLSSIDKRLERIEQICTRLEKLQNGNGNNNPDSNRGSNDTSCRTLTSGSSAS